MVRWHVRHRSGLRPVAAANVIGLLAVALVLPLESRHVGAQSVAPEYASVPEARCSPGDRPETRLQGQVPAEERRGGFDGFSCNLELVGQFAGEGASWQHAWYKSCAYYGTANREEQEHRGTVVIDASNARRPVATDYLDEPAMLDPWESLKVNQRRGLLGGVERAGPGFAVYDLKRDCRKPELLASIAVPRGNGHAGNFTPDGKTYYGASLTDINVVVDLSNPRRPKPLLSEPWQIPTSGIHDFSFSRDGTRGYLASIGNFVGGVRADAPGAYTGGNGLVIVDTTDIQRRRPNPQIEVISSLFWPDGSTGQMTQPVKIDGKPYLIFTDELGSGGATMQPAYANACGRGLPPFAFARIIDISNERKPEVVSKLTLEVHDPANCAEVINDNTGSTFGYDAHYCTVDDERDAVLLACSYFQAGLRIFDIRDPHRPREIAYYNPPQVPRPHGSNSNLLTGVDPAADWASANVRIKRNGEIWFTTQNNGFQIVRLSKPLRRLLR